jgi:hypothetical protein
VLAERYGADAPDLGTIIGTVSVVALTGAYLGNLAGGLTHDLSGTYAPAWRGFSAALLLSLAFPAALAVLPARSTTLARPDGGR